MSVRRPRPTGAARRGSAIGAAGVVIGLLLAGCGDETSSGGTQADDPTDAAATSTPTTGGPTTESPTPSPGDPASAGSSGSPTEPAVVYPSCTKVWVDGRRLSPDFDGCLRAGALVRPDGRYCEFGMPLITFGSHFYAVPGGIIHRTAKPLEQDPGYQKAVTLCQG